jgi:hypothetical protein
MNCPVCEGEMWDNRAKKTNPKAPDFRCKDKNCEGVIWPPKGRSGSHANAPGSPPPARFNGSSLDERQRAIIRQHSQSMALEVLKLKQMLNQLEIVDLSPAKLRILADYFDNDVLQKPEPKPHKSMEIHENESSVEVYGDS